VLRLGPGATIEGDVVTQDGAPVAAAEVEATVVPSSHPFGTTVGAIGTWDRRGATTTDGSFRLAGVPPAIDGVIRVRAEGFVPSTTQWSPGRSGRLRVVLHRSYRATVRVSDASGHALVGACVIAFRGPALRGTPDMTRRDVLPFRDAGDGTYVRDDLPVGWYWVLASRAGYRTSVDERAAFQAGVAPVEVVLHATPGLRGRVVDATTLAGIDGARVRMVPARRGVRPTDSAEATAYLVAADETDGPFVVTTDRDGTFDAKTAGPGDDVIVGVEADGYEASLVTRTGIAPDDVREIALRRLTTFEFSGRVVDPAGVPVAGAVVRGQRDVAVAAPDGRFLLPTRQSGAWVVVLAPGFTSPMARNSVRREETGGAAIRVDFGDVVLTPLVETAGLVVDRDDRPVPGVAVFASPAADLALPAGDGFSGCLGTSDVDGRVVLRLTPGDVYRLRASISSRSGETEVAGGAPEGFRLVVGPSADGDSGRVRGRVQWEDGTWEPALVMVVVRSDERTSPTLRMSLALPDGAFEIDGVPPGPWGLRVRAPGFEGDVERVDVPAGEIAEATIVCRRVAPPAPAERLPLTVRVTDAPPELAAWATRADGPTAGSRSIPLRRTPESNWTVSAASAGRYVVWCADAAGGRAGVLVDAAPGAADPPAVRLLPAGRLLLPAPPKDRTERWIQARNAAGVVVFSGLEDDLPTAAGEGRHLLLPPGDWTVEVSRGIGRKEPATYRATVVAGRSIRFE